ncbi:MAG: hypothetical protein RBU23_10715 [Candidatus Auribacterota bacterium]|jgi:tetratricopeptide (TPR) repeat protein|nr:hypothetical protein [Candidatus Auribacterota bacterium]
MNNCERYSFFLYVGRLPYFLLCTAVFITYIHTVTYPFVKWDDYAYIVDNPDMYGSFFETIRNIFTSRMHGNYFPLHLLSYLIELKIFGVNPMFFHLNNVLLHMANVCLAYKLFTGFAAGWLPAFIGALLFAVHPVHVESVVWVSERKDVLYLFLFLFSFILLRLHLKHGKTGYLLVSLILYGCSLLSKSAAIVFPLIAMVTHLYLSPLCSTKNFFRKIWPYFIMAGIGIALQIVSKDLTEIMGEKKTFLKMTEVFLRYIVHLLYPIRLSPRYDRLPDIPLIFIFAGLACLVYGIIRSKHIRWAVLWMLIGLLPVLNIIPIQIIMTDRYLYLPALGMYYIAGVGAITRLRYFSVKLLLVSIAVAITCCMALSLKQTTTWNSSYALWRKVMVTNPYDTFPLINQGLIAYDETGDAERALFWFNKALSIEPDSPQINAQIGSLYYNEGLFDNAGVFLQKVASIPNARLKYPEALLKLAHIESLQDNFLREIAVLQEGLVTDLRTQFEKRLIEARERMQAVMTARTMIDIKSRDIEFIVHTIEQLHASGHIVTAQRLIDAALKKYSDNEYILFLAGMNSLMQNNRSEAAEYFNRITSIEEPFMNFFTQFMVERNQLDSSEFLQRLRGGMSKFPDKNILLLEYGLYLTQTGCELQESKDVYMQIMRSQPGWWHISSMISLRKFLSDQGINPYK